MIKVGIIGGAGYTAGELIRLLLNHPDVDINLSTAPVMLEIKSPMYMKGCMVILFPTTVDKLDIHIRN